MSDISVTALPRRPRRGGADATVTADRAAPRPEATPIALWEHLAQQTQLAIVVFDERNCARLISPAAAALLQLPAEATIGEPADVVLASLRREDAAPETLHALLSPPRQHDAPIMAQFAHLGTARYRVQRFAVAFDDAARTGGALLFEAIGEPDNEALNADLDEFLTRNLAEITDAADQLRRMSRRGDAEAQRELADIARSASLEARRALEDARALRETRARTFQLHPEPIELSDLMMALMAEWQQSFPNHLFELALPGELPSVTVDAARVRKALALVLRVAVSLSPPGNTVRVALRSVEDDVQVSVRTYHVRFPKELAPSFARPFQRIALGLGASVPLGLELPLARALIGAHGGSLRVESADPEPGLLLIAMLPRVPVVVTPAPQPERDTAAASLTPAKRVTPQSRATALIALRDQRMLRYLRANLDARAYHCCAASTLEDAERQIDLEDPDLVLLDMGIEDGDPSEALRRLRALSSAEFIILANRHDPIECARLLDGGAADYLVVPLSLEELVSRMRVVMRSRERGVREANRGKPFLTGGLRIDFEQRAVTVEGQPVALSKTEYKLLRTLAEHAGMVLSHDALLARVWGPGYGQEVAFAWVYIRRLRKKIEPDPAHPRYILTVPGVGYRLAKD